MWVFVVKANSFKWTEWEGQIAGKLVLFLNRKNFNTCAQKDSAVTVYDEVVFCDIQRECEPNISLVRQCDICRLSLVIGRQLIFHLVPFGNFTPVLKLVFLL